MKTLFKKANITVAAPVEAGHCGTNRTGQTKTIF